VLAAGQGTRMKSGLPKPLHLVGGVPIVERVIRAGLAIDPGQLVVVVNDDMLDLPERLGMADMFETTTQTYPYGTAGAVRSAIDHLAPTDWIVSLLGDSVLLTGETVRALVDGAVSSGSKITILTCILPDAETYGRIERDKHGNACRIVEYKNDHPDHRNGATEINSGIMVLESAWARDALSRLEQNAQAGEYLLTDILEVAIADMREGDPWPIATVVGHPEVALGINDRQQQAEADAIIRRKVRQRLQREGVTIVGEESVYIDETVSVGPDTVILPFSVITGHTTIGSHCQIGPHAVLHNASIADHVHVRSSTVTDSEVGAGSDVGPYAHLRGNTRVGPNVHVGTSAEMKNACLGEGTRVGHFSYLGDASLGEGVNVGAGTITANYDGHAKHPTVVGDQAFIGSDSVLVAPLRIGAGARTGAGAVVTRDVADGTTVVGVPARPMTVRRPAPVDDSEE
jgi:bifunctional UDP-N-acetylglucosamine pyrophosphorylase/glucosamine-1-phosphate N-acetyltransferase